MEEVKFMDTTDPAQCWVVAFDTLCGGWDAVKDENGDIFLHTEEEADTEVKDCNDWDREADKELAIVEGEEFDEDAIYDAYFKVHMDDYIHGRKTIVSIEDNNLVGSISGTKPTRKL